jgi:thermitase
MSTVHLAIRPLLAALAFAAFSTSFVHAQEKADAFRPKTSGRILVQPREGVDIAGFGKWARTQRVETLRVHAGLRNLHVMHSAERSEDEVIAMLQGSGLVEFAEPDYIITASLVPNDTAAVNGTAWALKQIGLPAAWDRVHFASNVVVAIVDSGIRLTHQELKDNLWTNAGEVAGNGVDDDKDGVVDDVHGFNAIDHSGDVSDDVGHGTHVAGIIGAAGNNGKGSSGVAWNVQLMPLKFLDATGEGATSDAISCIDYARTHGAHIINASWGSGSSSQSLRSAITRARSAGIIFVAAAGNDGMNNDRSPNYPSSYALDNIVAVGASDRSDGLASFSDFGAASVDLLAPGVSIYSTWDSSDSAYKTLDGTSMATPFVTGTFALLKARFPDKSYTQLIAAVLNSVDKVSAAAGKTVSGGRLNVAAALNYLAPATTPQLKIAQSGGILTISVAAGDPGSPLTIEQSSDLTTWNSVAALTLDSSGAASTSIVTTGGGLSLFRAFEQ